LIFADIGILVLVWGWRGGARNTTVTGMGSGHFAGNPMRAGTGLAGRMEAEAQAATAITM
jgi:hypothetical protein